jgi:hypothetical protein
MAMSQGEIDQLLDKLRKKYKEHAAKHDTKWFDIRKFEERYTMALDNRMNLEAFILAEVANFEKIIERYDKKKVKPSISEKIDHVIEENNARMIKYPEIKFHPKAGFEIIHFYGAAADLVLNYMPIFWNLIKDPSVKRKFEILEEKLNFMALPKGTQASKRMELQESKRIEEHLNILSRKHVMDIEIERDKNDYLKETAFLLHDIIDLCDRMMERKDPSWDFPLAFDKLYVEDKQKEQIEHIFNGKTGYGAIMAIREYVHNILEDFRLTMFRRRENE